MNIENVNKETIKSVITEILIENPGYFKMILAEILEENGIIAPKESEEETSRLKQMIQEDFDQYDEVFKSLA